jgi:hypothetical protein
MVTNQADTGVMKAELHWTLTHMVAKRSVRSSARTPEQILSQITALIGLGLGSRWRQEDRSFGQVADDIQNRREEAVYERGFWGRMSGPTFQLAPPNFRSSNYWIPRAKGRVEAAPEGATVTVTLRSIQMNQVFVLVTGVLAAMGLIVGGAALVGIGTSGGGIAIGVGLIILAVLGIFVRGASKVARVMTDALSAQLDDII